MKNLLMIMILAIGMIGCQKDEVGTPTPTTPQPTVILPGMIADGCSCGYVVTHVRVAGTVFDSTIRNYCTNNDIVVRSTEYYGYSVCLEQYVQYQNRPEGLAW